MQFSGELASEKKKLIVSRVPNELGSMHVKKSNDSYDQHDCPDHVINLEDFGFIINFYNELQLNSVLKYVLYLYNYILI